MPRRNGPEMPRENDPPMSLPPALSPDASPGARLAHERAMEEFLTEGGQPLQPRPGEDPAMASLRALERDHQRFLALHQPMRSALLLSLMRSREELEARAESSSVPAIIAIAEAATRKAMAGDMQAVGYITERIEGKAGMRQGDVDPEADTRRADMVAAIEGVVRVLTDGKRAQTVEGEATEVVDENDSQG